MYPHERSLVKKFANKPFTILGVNSDPRKTLARVQKEKDLTWRSFWDGGNTRGPIASRWNVSGWPTIYLIDAQGIIRYRFQGPLDQRVWEQHFLPRLQQLVAAAPG